MSKARGLADLGNVYNDGALSNRNLIINGSMTISQRYGTAASNLGGSSVFSVDRFNCFGPSASSTSTAQQVTDTPAGFKNSLKYTCGTGLSVTGGDYAQITQIMEGNNVAHLKWGTADALDVTVSFWVKSSLTGTFSFGVQNGPTNRSYVAQYAVGVANTWEYKAITISGDTSGTWSSDNTAAMRLVWDMGFGYGATSTVDAWQAGDVHYVAGNVKVNETSGATFNITGVQLEVGDTATPFEHRSYGQELALCERYLFVADSNRLSAGNWDSLGWSPRVVFHTEMRTSPSVSLTAGGFRMSDDYAADHTTASTSLASAQTTKRGARLYMNSGWSGTPTTGRTYIGYTTGSATGLALFDAEL